MQKNCKRSKPNVLYLIYLIIARCSVDTSASSNFHKFVTFYNTNLWFILKKQLIKNKYDKNKVSQLFCFDLLWIYSMQIVQTESDNTILN